MLSGIGCYGFGNDFKVVSENQASLGLASKQIEVWFTINRIKLNAKKCTLINIKGNLQWFLNGEMLSSVATQGDLGVLVSANLNLNGNCELQASNAAKAFCLIKRKNVPKLCSKANKLIEYKGLIRCSNYHIRLEGLESKPKSYAKSWKAANEGNWLDLRTRLMLSW